MSVHLPLLPLLPTSISLSIVTASIHQFTKAVNHSIPQKDLIKNSTVVDFETQQEQLFIVGTGPLMQ